VISKSTLLFYLLKVSRLNQSKHKNELLSEKLQASLTKLRYRQTATDITYDEKKDLATMTFAESVPANTKAILDIAFEGELNDIMAGFYRSSYKDAEGNTQYLATTQFESTDARRAFPCWDEPSLKATFDVTLVVPADLVALSNMDVKLKVKLKERLRVRLKVRLNWLPRA
jgi:aminopeptidase 2